jgi:hypothetical protein
LQRFLSTWGTLQQAFEVFPFRECPHGDPREYTIPAFSDANPLRLAHVLNMGASDSPDFVLRMLRERLLPAIDDVLQSADLQQLRNSDSFANRLGCNAELAAPVLSLEAMPPLHAAVPLLLTGCRSATRGGSSRFGRALLDPHLERFIASHGVRILGGAAEDGTRPTSEAATTVPVPPRWDYDVHAIFAFLLSRYFAGRAVLKIGA